jgi:hypothetical protein
MLSDYPFGMAHNAGILQEIGDNFEASLEPDPPPEADATKAAAKKKTAAKGEDGE